MPQFSMQDATIVIQDGSEPPNWLALDISEGNFSYTEHNDTEHTPIRGKIGTLRYADEAPIDVSATLIWDSLTSNDPDNPTFEDAIKRRGGAVGWKSSNTDDPCAPYMVDIILYLAPPCGDDSASQKITLPNFVWNTLNHDGSTGTIIMDGICLAKEALVEPLSLTISDVAFTPTSAVAGSNITVTWSADFLNAGVQIDLLPGGVADDAIFLGSGTASTGSRVVQIPSTVAAGSDYKIRVMNAQNPLMFGISTADLTVTTP